MLIDGIREALVEHDLDGWLFYDFRRSNPIAHRVLELPGDALYTRRWFYYVPSVGEPTAVISAVDPHVLITLPGDRRVFRTWQDLHHLLGSIVTPGTTVAMEYSPLSAIPSLSRVDAGTVDLVRSLGAAVVSSADLAQRLGARLSAEQIESHREAGRRLIECKDRLFAELGRAIGRGDRMDEYTIQKQFVALMQDNGLVVPEPPLVAVNGNASNPHHEPSADDPTAVRRSDLILFDFWARLPGAEAIYADFTWMGFAGSANEIPEPHRNVFSVVRAARDAGIEFVGEQLAHGVRPRGCDVDDRVRTVVESSGLGEYFAHRTGHNISTEVHGDGTNLDNLETHDDRRLLSGTCCSVEPGVYLPEFGVRSEVNLVIHDGRVEVTGVPVQNEITPLLS